MLVESGIENDDLLQVGERFARGVNPGNVRRIVQRCEADAVHNLLAHIIIDQYRFGKILAAVDDAVADRLDFVHQAFLLQRIDDDVQRFLVRAGVKLLLNLATGGVLDGDIADAADAQAFGQTLERLLAVFRVDDREFQAGRAAVQNKNIVGHDDSSGLKSGAIVAKKRGRRAAAGGKPGMARVFGANGKNAPHCS